MKIIKGILGIILVLLIMFGLYILFMTLTDYKPDKITQLNVENNTEKLIDKSEVLSVLTYNIGYCGLDEDRDFFMDGGKESRGESKERTIDNLNNITEFIRKNNSDFILLQEVDLNSTRSYKVDQYTYMKENLSHDYDSIFAYNYKVPWVPLPILKPHGKVEAGLVTFSKYNIKEAARYQYPGEYSWPKQLGMLDRCFTEQRSQLEDGKELVVINSHLSAYDKGGVIRKQQLEFLRKYLIEEYDKGNYIVVGGDWNHVIPGTEDNEFKNEHEWPEWLNKIPDNFKPEGFKWAADKTVPTNRTLDMPYKKGKNYISVIDGFLVSPNIKILETKGYNCEFKYSDHNPVVMKFMLD